MRIAASVGVGASWVGAATSLRAGIVCAQGGPILSDHELIHVFSPVPLVWPRPGHPWRMPQPRSHIPARLGPVFSFAQALEQGVTPRTLQGPTTHRPYFGVHAVGSLEGTPGPRTFAPRLREGECFSHTTALELLGCPIRATAEVHVCAPPNFDRSRTRGVIGHRSASGFVPARSAAGLPVVPPELAILQSAALLSLVELVVALDHLAREDAHQLPTLDLESLTTVVERSTARGIRRLRRALTLARVGAESRMETLTRLLMVAFRLDRSFALQQHVYDDDGWIGRFDFVDHERRIIVEYDGEQHRTDRAQYRRDQERLDRVRAAGYVLIRLQWEDIVVHPRRTVQRIAAALGVVARERRDSSQFMVR